jgi:hypothetical protein
MKRAIDQHACTVQGRLHRFRFQWAAVEPRWGSRGARYLLAVDVLADGASLDPTPRIHVITRASISHEELLGLVGDALNDYLRTGRDSFVAVSPGASATLVSP